MLSDMYGHQVYVTPGDTVLIGIDSLPNNDVFLKQGILSPWSVKFSYSGSRGATHGLFDSLAYVQGATHLTLFGPKATKFDLEKYIDSVVIIRNARKRFLALYIKQYNLPTNVVSFATSEIEWSFADMLLTPLRFYQFGINRNSLGTRYIQLIEAFKFMPDEFFNTSFIQFNVLSDYIRYYATKFKAEEAYNANHLEEQGTFIELNYNQNVRLVLLTKILSEYLANGILPSQTTMEKLSKADPTKKSFDEISARRTKLLEQKQNFNSVLTQPLIDINGQSVTLNELNKNGPILIDCWASWCKPCIEQLPDLKAWEIKYGKQISFISVSFDSEQQKWKDAVTKHQIAGSNAFFLPDNFASGFANYFSLHSIPRYILLNRKGELICSDCPVPSNRNAFEKNLQTAIND